MQAPTLARLNKASSEPVFGLQLGGAETPYPCGDDLLVSAEPLTAVTRTHSHIKKNTEQSVESEPLQQATGAFVHV